MNNINKFIKISFLFLLVFDFGGALAQTKSYIQKTNNPIIGGARKTIVILGDGFQNKEQDQFNNYIDGPFMDALRLEGFGEHLDSFEIIRVNVNSVDSGVTEISTVIKNNKVTTSVSKKRNTAFDWGHTGDWNSGWFKRGSKTNKLTNEILKKLKITPDYKVYVINEAGEGGLRVGNEFIVTLSENTSTLAHEMGHMFGGLCDEYVQANALNLGSYKDQEPGCVNLTTNISSKGLKWKEWRDASTPLPTVLSPSMNRVQTVGAFLGGNAINNSGIWRPTDISRMNNNWPIFNPPSHNHMMNTLALEKQPAFKEIYPGDFDGDGRGDILIHRGNSLIAYRATESDNFEYMASVVDRVNGSVPNAHLSWADKILIGDFDGDNRDEIGVASPHNDTFMILERVGRTFTVTSRIKGGIGNTNILPISRNNQYFILDFNGDRKDDIAVFNVSDFKHKALSLYSSIGRGKFRHTKLYKDKLPNWEMTDGDHWLIGDYDGDGREELSVYNVKNWKEGYVGIYKSDSTSLKYVKRYRKQFGNWKKMTQEDRVQVGDFNGDNKTDFLITNVAQRYWCCEYLAFQSSTGRGVQAGVKYQNSVPGWILSAGDKFYVADHNNDGRDDVIAINTSSWKTEKLGVLTTQNNFRLRANYQSDWVGKWNLRDVDKFIIMNLNNRNGKDIFVYNKNWAGGLMASGNGFRQASIHPNYIKDYLFHVGGHW